MNIRDYVKKHNITLNEFAERMQISRTFLCCVMGGRRGISERTLNVIRFHTKGEILTKEDLFSPPPAGHRGPYIGQPRKKRACKSYKDLARLQQLAKEK